MIAGFYWIKWDLFGRRNRSGKVISNSCAYFITDKEDGRDTVKEHWDVGVPFKDGIAVREIYQTSEEHNWKESVSLLPDIKYIRFYLLRKLPIQL